MKDAPDEIFIGLDGGATAIIVVTEDTPDEARLALLDLDVTAPELRGKLLRWDETAGEWRPSELPAGLLPLRLLFQAGSPAGPRLGSS
jgi:hypothetical protein